MDAPLEGIFPVLQTPFDNAGAVDPAGLTRQVEACVAAGCHGLVYPVLGGEFQFLTNSERACMVETVIHAAGGRVPVVAGVAGASPPIAVEHARHAAAAGADAVIALPPFIGSPGRDELAHYYRSIAAAAGIPVFIQHSGPGMDAGLLARLLHDIEKVEYIKEEMAPSAHHISAVIEAAGDACRGVFGGAHGRWMLSELRRGAPGFMPAAEAVELHVAIWNAYQSGDCAGARRLFNALLPLINLILLLGLRVCKEVLVRRGIIATATMRLPGATVLDAQDQEELTSILEDLHPFLHTVD